MSTTKLYQYIRESFSYQPTPDQECVIRGFDNFVRTSGPDGVFLLKGYAGTGKTALVGAFVKAFFRLGWRCVLLAPTGRAAKVFSLYAGHSAYTIHRRIYRQRVYSAQMDNFVMNANLHQHTLFIVDEASMISNDGLSGGVFGSGYLLDDLVSYVYGGVSCRLMLVGDTAQLPPVGDAESPALCADKLRSYGLEVSEHTLTEVVRQESGSGILYNATRLRLQLYAGRQDKLPCVSISGYEDLSLLSGEELIETITASYACVGMDETMIVCRSNKRANLYNRGIRNTILYREDELNSGDRLMVAKNNYFWTSGLKELEFIANGDIAVVRRVRRVREMYGFRFADVVLAFPDYDDLELEVKVLLDTLHSDAPALGREENERLFRQVAEDYAEVTSKRERMKKIKEDAWYNALQVKYAYAVTCHKAQGGQWKHVFVDQGFIAGDTTDTDYLRWLYTAMTRATEKLYLVNWPEAQTDKGEKMQQG